MITRVNTYRASDGQTFWTRKECVQYEKDLVLAPEIRELVKERLAKRTGPFGFAHIINTEQDEGFKQQVDSVTEMIVREITLPVLRNLLRKKSEEPTREDDADEAGNEPDEPQMSFLAPNGIPLEDREPACEIELPQEIISPQPAQKISPFKSRYAQVQ